MRMEMIGAEGREPQRERVDPIDDDSSINKSSSKEVFTRQERASSKWTSRVGILYDPISIFPTSPDLLQTYMHTVYVGSSIRLLSTMSH